MKITFLKFGKCAHNEAERWADLYMERIQHFQDTKSQIVKIGNASQEITAKMLSAHIRPQALVVLLDEKGKTYNTREFSAFISQTLENPGFKEILFVVGGPYGFESEAKKLAHTKISLSSFTFQGDLAWVILTEQVYRAFTILRKMPYHHD